MNLFRRSQTEPAPTPAPAPKLSALASAELELASAERACAEATQLCAALDEEKRNWPARREAAFADANAAMTRHAKAKDALARLETAPFLRGHGSASPLASVAGGLVMELGGK
jgi:hypothetical protein